MNPYDASLRDPHASANDAEIVRDPACRRGAAPQAPSPRKRMRRPIERASRRLAPRADELRAFAKRHVPHVRSACLSAGDSTGRRLSRVLSPESRPKASEPPGADRPQCGDAVGSAGSFLQRPLAGGMS